MYVLSVQRLGEHYTLYLEDIAKVSIFTQVTPPFAVSFFRIQEARSMRRRGSNEE